MPIVLVGLLPFDRLLWDAAEQKNHEDRRDVMMRFYLALKAAGDRNIHFIDGNGLLPAGQSGIYTTGVHPTSHGFAPMTERLAPQLRLLLNGVD